MCDDSPSYQGGYSHERGMRHLAERKEGNGGKNISGNLVRRLLKLTIPKGMFLPRWQAKHTTPVRERGRGGSRVEKPSPDVGEKPHEQAP